MSRLNSAAGGTPVDVGEELRDLIARALDFSAATDGAFDITLAPVSSAAALRGGGACPPGGGDRCLAGPGHPD
ncbi:ApbE family [uncultured Blautia sp.]|nr:ApbE family [uncultured Blautia sp.]